MKKYRLEMKIIFSVIITSLLLLTVTTMVIALFLNKHQDKEVRKSLKVKSEHLAAINDIKMLLIEEDTEKLQRLTNELINLTEVDFIVVLNDELVRLTHPVENKIGKKFSSVADAKGALTGKSYFTKNKGVLGDGLRYFTPIYSQDNQTIIGVLCVGSTINSLNLQKQPLIQRITLMVIFSTILMLLPILFIFKKFSRHSKGKSIEEVLYSYRRYQEVWDGIEKNILVIDPKGKIIFNNKSFETNFKDELVYKEDGLVLSKEFYGEMVFGNEIQSDIPLFYQNKEFRFIRYPIIEENQLVGYILTIEDNDYQQALALEIGGMNQYLNTLRSQNHEFMNKMHIVSALIELEQYDEVLVYINSLQHDYHEEIGQFNRLIQTPLITGFLLGKKREAEENNVVLILDERSKVGQLALNPAIYDFIQVVGTIIDNSIDALANQENGKISILVNETEEGLQACISNNGPKILIKPVERIFEKNVSTKGEFRGFGLYIAKGIVSRNNGLIKVDSSVEGTSFSFSMKVKEGGGK